MVASVVLGVIALALVAVTSSTVRSAGRSTRMAMGLSARRRTRSPRTRPGRELTTPLRPTSTTLSRTSSPTIRGSRTRPPLAAEVADAPRWGLGMAILSGGGLVLRLLLVMVGDHVTARKRP